jgi:hypothetical protein
VIDGEQGRKLGDEVWKEMTGVLENEATEIRDIVSAP